MSIGGHKIRDKKQAHFLTFTVVEWVDVFSRQVYRDILLDSFKYCQKEKGLLLHSWCIMTNHVHIIAPAKDENLSDIARDFKKHTSKQIIKAIEQNAGESRKEWMLKVFKDQGSKNSRNKEYQFWRQDNCPIELYSAKFSLQKLTYIHENPVRAGIVDRAEDYLYSSARDYRFMEQRGLLQIAFL
jgi:putative transposase